MAAGSRKSTGHHRAGTYFSNKVSVRSCNSIAPLMEERYLPPRSNPLPLGSDLPQPILQHLPLLTAYF